MTRPDRRSAQAEAYRHLYKTARWKRTRAEQLAKQPLCETCLSQGRITAATVCNHADKDSKATIEGFYAGPFTSECAPCHNGVVQRDEVRADAGKLPIQACRPDGWPV